MKTFVVTCRAGMINEAAAALNELSRYQAFVMALQHFSRSSLEPNKTQKRKRYCGFLIYFLTDELPTAISANTTRVEKLSTSLTLSRSILLD